MHRQRSCRVGWVAPNALVWLAFSCALSICRASPEPHGRAPAVDIGPPQPCRFVDDLAIDAGDVCAFDGDTQDGVLDRLCLRFPSWLSFDVLRVDPGSTGSSTQLRADDPKAEVQQGRQDDWPFLGLTRYCWYNVPVAPGGDRVLELQLQLRRSEVEGCAVGAPLPFEVRCSTPPSRHVAEKALRSAMQIDCAGRAHVAYVTADEKVVYARWDPEADRWTEETVFREGSALDAGRTVAGLADRAQSIRRFGLNVDLALTFEREDPLLCFIVDICDPGERGCDDASAAGTSSFSENVNGRLILAARDADGQWRNNVLDSTDPARLYHCAVAYQAAPPYSLFSQDPGPRIAYAEHLPGEPQVRFSAPRYVRATRYADGTYFFSAPSSIAPPRGPDGEPVGIGLDMDMAVSTAGRVHVTFRGSHSGAEFDVYHGESDGFDWHAPGAGVEQVMHVPSAGDPSLRALLGTGRQVLLGTLPALAVTRSGGRPRMSFTLHYPDGELGRAGAESPWLGVAFAAREGPVGTTWTTARLWDAIPPFDHAESPDIDDRGNDYFRNVGLLSLGLDIFVGIPSSLVLDRADRARIAFVEPRKLQTRLESRFRLEGGGIVKHEELVPVERDVHQLMLASAVGGSDPTRFLDPCVIDGRVEKSASVTIGVNAADDVRVLFHNRLEPRRRSPNATGSLQYLANETGMLLNPQTDPVPCVHPPDPEICDFRAQARPPVPCAACNYVRLDARDLVLKDAHLNLTPNLDAAFRVDDPGDCQSIRSRAAALCFDLGVGGFACGRPDVFENVMRFVTLLNVQSAGFPIPGHIRAAGSRNEPDGMCVRSEIPRWVHAADAIHNPYFEEVFRGLSFEFGRVPLKKQGSVCVPRKSCTSPKRWRIGGGEGCPAGMEEAVCNWHTDCRRLRSKLYNEGDVFPSYRGLPEFGCFDGRCRPIAQCESDTDCGAGAHCHAFRSWPRLPPVRSYCIAHERCVTDAECKAELAETCEAGLCVTRCQEGCGSRICNRDECISMVDGKFRPADAPFPALCEPVGCHRCPERRDAGLLAASHYCERDADCPALHRCLRRLSNPRSPMCILRPLFDHPYFLRLRAELAGDNTGCACPRCDMACTNAGTPCAADGDCDGCNNGCPATPTDQCVQLCALQSRLGAWRHDLADLVGGTPLPDPGRVPGGRHVDLHARLRDSTIDGAEARGGTIQLVPGPFPFASQGYLQILTAFAGDVSVDADCIDDAFVLDAPAFVGLRLQPYFFRDRIEWHEVASDVVSDPEDWTLVKARVRGCVDSCEFLFGELDAEEVDERIDDLTSEQLTERLTPVVGQIHELLTTNHLLGGLLFGRRAAQDELGCGSGGACSGRIEKLEIAMETPRGTAVEVGRDPSRFRECRARQSGGPRP